MKTLIGLVLIALLLHARYRLGYSWKDIFSPTRWRAVLIWLLKKAVRKLDGSEMYLTKSELIQYAYRVSQCGECIQKGKCVNCNCDAEGRFNGRTDTCSLNKWGVFLSEEEMENFLKNNKLIFTVKTEKKDGI